MAVQTEESGDTAAVLSAVARRRLTAAGRCGFPSLLSWLSRSLPSARLQAYCLASECSDEKDA